MSTAENTLKRLLVDELKLGRIEIPMFYLKQPLKKRASNETDPSERIKMEFSI